MKVGAALTAEISRLMPGLEARWHAGAGAHHAWFDAPLDELAALHRHWATRHPEAGPHFAGLRGWALWVWQPVCFMVLSTHLAPAPFAPQQLSQRVSGGRVQALRLHAPSDKADGHWRLAPEPVTHTAGLWRDALERARQTWQAVSGLGRKAAQAVERDLVLAAVASLHQDHGAALSSSNAHPPADSQAQAQALARRWTEALGLPLRTPYLASADDSATRLVVCRAVCCLEWRCAGGQTCMGCPRRHLAQGGLTPN